MRRFVLFADRPPSELRERAVRLRRAALTAMTPKGMRALIDLATSTTLPPRSAMAPALALPKAQLDRLAAAADERVNDPRRTTRCRLSSVVQADGLRGRGQQARAEGEIRF